MPFEVFRRHQRKLIAIFGILAMFAFVVSDSLPRLLSPSTGGRDQKVAELYGRSVYDSQLRELAQQRNRANLFVASMSPYMPQDFFGGLKQRDLVDAMILEHEADKLGIPATADIAREALTDFAQTLRMKMNNELFSVLYNRFSNEVSEEQLLVDIANQIRLRKVRGLLGLPIVTPYDVYRSYREQNERLSAKAIEIPVEAFTDKVGEPTAADLQALFDKYKDVLPNPSSETPGFKIPRQLQFEVLSIDGPTLTESIRKKLTDAELHSYYENHKQEFEVPSDLPRDLFAEQPDLTPPVYQSYADVQEMLAPRLAEERAQQEIQDQFTDLSANEFIPFAEDYLNALDDLDEAKKQGRENTVTLPKPNDLKAVADKGGLNYEKTELLSAEAADQHGAISTAQVGLTPLSGGRKFVDEMFDPKTGLYDPVEFTDILGTRFIVRKIQDVAPHVPSFDEVKSEVAHAWKLEKARPLAEKAAEELAKQVQEKKAEIKEPKYEAYRVVSIPPITHSQMSYAPTLYDMGSAVETPIPGIPLAGQAFRNAYFSLVPSGPGSVVAAPNEPKTVYYVLELDQRDAVTFNALYAPNGDEFRYKSMVRNDAARQQDDQWMNVLRQQAGLPPDWVAPEDVKKENERS